VQQPQVALLCTTINGSFELAATASREGLVRFATGVAVAFDEATFEADGEGPGILSEGCAEAANAIIDVAATRAKVQAFDFMGILIARDRRR
jgi:hypothetical protein